MKSSESTSTDTVSVALSPVGRYGLLFKHYTWDDSQWNTGYDLMKTPKKTEIELSPHGLYCLQVQEKGVDAPDAWFTPRPQGERFNEVQRVSMRLSTLYGDAYRYRNNAKD